MKPAAVLLLDGSKLFSLNDNMHVVDFFFFLHLHDHCCDTLKDILSFGKQ